MSSTWTNEKIIDFINEIHLHPELWNVEMGIYKDRNAKKDGWTVIAEKFGITSDEAYKKFRSLRTYAKNEEKKRVKSGSAGGKSVKWFAFDAISFVLSQDTPNIGLDSENATHVIESLDTENSADQEEVVDSETADSLLSPVSVTKPRAPKRPKTKDPILERAENIIRDATHKKPNEYASLGEHIANKLSKYDDYTRAQAEFKIMQILFECDMAMYRNQRLSCASLQSPDNDSRSGANTSVSHYSDVATPNSTLQNNSTVYVPQCQDFTTADQTLSMQNNYDIPQHKQYASTDQADLTTTSSYAELVTLTMRQCNE